MSTARGSICVAGVVATATLVGCSAAPDDSATPGPETVTVTYSSSTSNAPTTQTVTSSPSSTRGPGSASPTSGSTPSSDRSTSSTSSTSGSSDDLPTSPAGYADAFVRAWGRGDRSAASTYGSSAAMSSLFDAAGNGGPGWTRTSTTGYAGSTEVHYSDGSRALVVVVDHEALGAGDEHAVISATFDEDVLTPTEPVDDDLPRTRAGYADAFVRAWGKSDSSAWDYASDSVQTTLGGGPGPDAGSWRRTSSTASSVSYRDGSGSTLVLTLDDARVRAGLKDAITGATLS